MEYTLPKQAFSILVFGALGTACGRIMTEAQDAYTFVMQVPGGDLARASLLLTNAFLQEAETGSDFAQSYPIPGYISPAPSADDPVELDWHCTSAPAADHPAIRCLLLSHEGDFLLVEPHERLPSPWFPYTIYVVPRSHLARMDRFHSGVLGVQFSSKKAPQEFVKSAIFRAADRTLRDALESLGATEYRDAFRP